MKRRPTESPPVSPARIRKVAEQIIQARATLSYMTVARAMFLDAYLGNPKRASQVANALGISKQTAFNWVWRDLLPWVLRWESRLKETGKADRERAGENSQILYEDWVWMADILSKAPRRNREFRVRVIREAARKDAKYAHLARIHRNTLKRYEKELLNPLIDEAWRERARLAECEEGSATARGAGNSSADANNDRVWGASSMVPPLGRRTEGESGDCLLADKPVNAEPDVKTPKHVDDHLAASTGVDPRPGHGKIVLPLLSQSGKRFCSRKAPAPR